jgi:head-tail adaptor
MARTPEIGSLRWKVLLFRRNQAPATGSGIAETLERFGEAWADIQPVGAMTFYGAAQTDTPVTHRIILRWRFGLDTTHAVQRTTRGPDGVERLETFRVRRSYDLDGRKRFLVIEAELERVA